jgi:hypothetical protein
MKRSLRLLSSTLLLLFFWSPLYAFEANDDDEAEDPVAHAMGILQGTFVSSEHPREVNRKIERAIHQATSSMNFLIRGKARGHLVDLTRPCKDFTLNFPDGDAVVQCEERRPSRAPVDGQGVQRVSASGEHYELVHEIEREDRLTQYHRSKNGTRRDVYVVSLDGRRLTVHTTIQSQWLSRPVEYQLHFVRRR